MSLAAASFASCAGRGSDRAAEAFTAPADALTYAIAPKDFPPPKNALSPKETWPPKDGSPPFKDATGEGASPPLTGPQYPIQVILNIHSHSPASFLPEGKGKEELKKGGTDATLHCLVRRFVKAADG